MNEIIMYKLVSQDYKTYDGMLWEIGKTNKAKGAGIAMCSAAVLHCYSDPWLAVFFNRIHANINNPRLLKVQCSEIVANDGCKFACKEQTPIEELELPTLSVTQKVAFGIKCVMQFYFNESFTSWAVRWLTGEDRTKESARDADYDAADAAADAAYAAAKAADYAAGDADYAAGDAAADAAAYVAADAALANKSINFIKIKNWVIQNIE